MKTTGRALLATFMLFVITFVLAIVQAATGTNLVVFGATSIGLMFLSGIVAIISFIVSVFNGDLKRRHQAAKNRVK